MNAPRVTRLGWWPGWEAFADLVFPPVCVACDEVPEGGGLRHVCARCEILTRVVVAPHCCTCGHPFFGKVVGEQLCPHCEALVPEFGEGRTVTLLKGAPRALVHALKYHAGFFALRDMEALARRDPEIAAWARDAVLVPVPLHPRKERERGYNQAQLLAEVFARVGGGQARVERLLQRVVDTETQTRHDLRHRRENLKNAFALAPGVAINPELRYLLVDDVFTTGSTLNSCARTLRRAGGVKVDVITFGHG